ncbi:SCP2 sterol-binding domain-containing protein [Halococcus qingdaonensis]|uniref:SCP2 sterol-binding domain-containing protein n=1 Tax=Halococcus qingdaonensis TaxID=224402 RepID=UPI0021161B71|nr:SCP2 sterol-binding domain-containing protein [Halococcus qingdaonensis]
MTDEQLIQRIETALEEEQDQLEADLLAILADMEGQTDELVREHPEVMASILGRMEAMDIASFVSENPETADQFQELLWSGMRVMVERNPEVKEQINEDITTNFEADDCPMEGHLKVREKEELITGGAGQLDDADITITGPADVLVGLITGNVDPIQGFMQQQYEMDGPVQKGTKLAPIMNSLSEQVPE